jgi:hypothetical protein
MYARYCSKECQAADWCEHKGACLAHCMALSFFDTSG